MCRRANDGALVVDQHGRHADEFTHLGERLLVLFAILQRIEIDLGDGGEIVQDLTSLCREIGLGERQQTERVQKTAYPVIEPERALAKRGRFVGGGELDERLGGLKVTFDGQTPGAQGRTRLGDERLPRVGCRGDLPEPGLQGVRVTAADQAAEDSMRLARRWIQRPGVEIAGDVRGDDVRSDLPSLRVCLAVWKIIRS